MTELARINLPDGMLVIGSADSDRTANNEEVNTRFRGPTGNEWVKAGTAIGDWLQISFGGAANVVEQSAAPNTITLETSGTGSGTGTEMYANTDVTPYNYVDIQVTTASGTDIILEESADGGTTYDQVLAIKKLTGAYAAIGTDTGMYHLPLSGNAFRIEQSGTGTPAVNIIFGVE